MGFGKVKSAVVAFQSDDFVQSSPFVFSLFDSFSRGIAYSVWTKHAIVGNLIQLGFDVQSSLFVFIRQLSFSPRSQRVVFTQLASSSLTSLVFTPTRSFSSVASYSTRIRRAIEALRIQSTSIVQSLTIEFKSPGIVQSSIIVFSHPPPHNPTVSYSVTCYRAVSTFRIQFGHIVQFQLLTLNNFVRITL